MEIVLPDGREVRVGTPVCYELLFPDLVRRFAADGGRALLAITNDAWYGRTGAPYQFLAITALRSAETGLWTARAANSGVSGFIDGTGSVRIATPIFEPTWRIAEVPLHPDPREATFYVRHGDVFAWGCWVLLAAHGVAAQSRSGESPQIAVGGRSHSGVARRLRKRWISGRAAPGGIREHVDQDCVSGESALDDQIAGQHCGRIGDRARLSRQRRRSSVREHGVEIASNARFPRVVKSKPIRSAQPAASRYSARSRITASAHC